MSNRTNALLATLTESLTKLKVPANEQVLALAYAEIFQRRAVEEDGRRTLAELQADTLKEMTDSFAVHREVWHALLLTEMLVNSDMNLVIKDEKK